LLRRTASVISKCSESVEWLQNLGVVASILKRSSMRTDRVLC
jgi:stalled ribosome rescue protein Dom34